MVRLENLATSTEPSTFVLSLLSTIIHYDHLTCSGHLEEGANFFQDLDSYHSGCVIIYCKILHPLSSNFLTLLELGPNWA